MKNFVKIFKKHWITIWLIIAVVSLSAVTSYSIYTRITIAKRVVSTQAGSASLFSSDHMSAGGIKTISPKTVDNEDASVTVHVYNYAYPQSALFRKDDTEYSLIARIGYLDSDETFHGLTDTDAINSLSSLNYSIKYEDGNETFEFGSPNGTSHSFEKCTIGGDSANSNTFTLTFDKIEFGSESPNYCIELMAEPYNVDLPKLKGYVMVRYSKSSTAGWSGEVEEIVLEKQNDYDGFNYYLEGNGKGMLTFRWDSSSVTINKDFLNNANNEFYSFSGGTYIKYSDPPVEADLLQDSNNMVSLTIKVDSSKQNRYEIQFFKTDSSGDYSKLKLKEYLPDTSPSDWIPDTN